MKPIVLLILDGWGIAPKSRGNAVELANKPNFDRLWQKYPHTTLKASGQFVGLPKGYEGNSEAGHINIGAGRIVKDDAVVISEDIVNKRFFKNHAINESIDHVIRNHSRLHLMGMISDGHSPHSSLDHLYALVDHAHARGIMDIYLHLFTDGRDAPPFAGLRIMDEVLKNVYGKAQIVSLMGRFYGMDRNKNWERTQMAYDCLTSCHGQYFNDYSEAILRAYNNKISDEFIDPSIICREKSLMCSTRIDDNDSVIFFNSRSDRTRQITKCFVQDDFNKMNPGAFRRKKVLKNLFFCALTDFGPDLDSINTAYPAAFIDFCLPKVLQHHKQLYIAESEKYAHVTYFINGGSDQPVNGEVRVRVPSLKIRSYDLKPQMRVYEVTKKVLNGLRNDKYDFITANFANPDMVGHTGNLQATIKAIEHVDKCLGQVANLIIKKKGVIIMIGDHGNAEKMYDEETKQVWTAHTTNPVPFLLVDNNRLGVKLRSGILGDVAPTIYELSNEKKIPNILNKSLIM